MPIPIFPPTRDADLLTWSANFDARITGDPTTYGLTAAQATIYAALHTAFADAYAAAQNPNSNSKSAVIAKNAARQALLDDAGGAWELVDIIQAYPGTTDAMRGSLGLRIPDVEPTPVPAPATAPDLSILSTLGRTVKVRLRDQDNPDKRGKPEGVQGATVLMFAGDAPPADPAQWAFALNVSRTVFDYEIPAAVAAGARLWLSAFWFNARKEPSPAATPESTRVSDGLSQAA